MPIIDILIAVALIISVIIGVIRGFIKEAISITALLIESAAQRAMRERNLRVVIAPQEALLQIAILSVIALPRSAPTVYNRRARALPPSGIEIRQAL